MTTVPTDADLKALVAEELEGVRRRSLDLLAPLPEPALLQQHSRLMSPLAWDLAHVGNYEDQWLLRAVDGPGARPDLDDIYDAFRHPRPGRPQLPLLPPEEARRYLAEVRGRVLELLDHLELAPDAQHPLVAGGYVYGMVIQHEHQHDETMLATLQLMEGEGYRPLAEPAPRRPAPTALPPIGSEVRVPAGSFVMGTDADPWAYDNERPAHPVDLPEYRIDVFPVTNAQFQEFMADGGYGERRWWSEEGWAWRQEAGLERPQFWEPAGEGSWARVRFGWHEPVPADEPVQHVCFHEAEAYSRWVGKRLPTEAEWERAAMGASTAEANLGQRHFGPAAAGAYPDGVSAVGCHQMLGDVWEWTSSDFVAYPGFRSFPYREYSEVFFDSGYKVLRGGSWATHPLAVRTTFRNWDHPIRRQIFAGFRCARDS